MKFKAVLFLMIFVLTAEISALILFMSDSSGDLQDAVSVNEAVMSVQKDFYEMEYHKNITKLDYTVIDNDGNVLFRTKKGLSESINQAIIHRDTILDIKSESMTVGKIIIYSSVFDRVRGNRKKISAVIISAAVFQFGLCAAYLIYLNCAVIKPFNKLEDFAERVAGGNLDIPLEMDRKNIFGAFTESFDIMRSELKKARIAEAKANASKKELIAKLSHDIRTPVASIKAASEVGAAIAENEKSKQNYTHIIHKADQINALVTNLFSATLEELQKLSALPADMKSCELTEMLESSDYFQYAKIPPVPDCMIFADKLRLQQVFDNIFANSYKYSNTKINVEIILSEKYLSVKIEDFGGGVPEKELPLLKEKFERGSNSDNIDGAGLGLYISDCLMKEMQGALVIENGQNGLAATVIISLCGKI